MGASAAQCVLAGVVCAFAGVTVAAEGAGLGGADAAGFDDCASFDAAGGWLGRVAVPRASGGRVAPDVRDGGTPTGCEK